MGKTRGKKLQAFCVNRIRPLVKVPVQNKLGSNSPYYSVKKSDQNNQVEGNNYAKIEEDSEKLKTSDQGRKIMVVVDSSVEAKVALQWALTHTVQSHDFIILLYVAKLTTKIGLYTTIKKNIIS